MPSDFHFKVPPDFSGLRVFCQPSLQEFYSFEALKTKLSDKPLQEVEELWLWAWKGGGAAERTPHVVGVFTRSYFAGIERSDSKVKTTSALLLPLLEVPLASTFLTPTPQAKQRPRFRRAGHA